MEGELVIVAHNVRSAYNIGAIFRTADGIGATKLYLSGYSPAPAEKGALHVTKAQKMIAKTALGAQDYLQWKRVGKIGVLIEKMKKDGFEILALEQHAGSIGLDELAPSGKIALIAGNEPKGIDARILKKCDRIVEIPMRGKKNSFNVSVALGIAAYDIFGKIKSYKKI